MWFYVMSACLVCTRPGVPSPAPFTRQSFNKHSLTSVSVVKLPNLGSSFKFQWTQQLQPSESILWPLPILQLWNLHLMRQLVSYCFKIRPSPPTSSFNTITYRKESSPERIRGIHFDICQVLRHLNSQTVSTFPLILSIFLILLGLRTVWTQKKNSRQQLYDSLGYRMKEC